MSRDVPRGLAHHIRDMTGLWRTDPRSDGELLSAFVAGDGAAFAALVVRHGRLVWATCRRVLGNDADAEDAFQAAFIALARSAGQVRPESVAGWLQKVSHSVALNARKAAQRREAAERRLLDRAAEAHESLPDEELRAAVAEEVARLPEQLRVPLTLYYLEGKTQTEIGRILGVTDRAAAHRLKQALKLLRDRLSQRGIWVAATVLVAVLGNVPITAAVPANLVVHATEIALAVAAGGPADTVAARLALEITQAHGWVRMKLCSLILIPAVCLVVGGVLLAQRPEQPALPEAPPPRAASAPHSADAPRTDRFGDPLPTGAVARLGTLRFRTGVATGLSSVAFGPSGKVLVSSHGENTVHFWDPDTGREIRKLDGPRACEAVTTTPDGKRLVAAGIDELWVWELSGDMPKLLWKVKAKPVGFANVEYSPDGKLLAYGGDNGQEISLLDSGTGAVVRTLPGSGYRFAFSADSKSLASWERWKVAEVCVWDAAAGKKRYTLIAAGEEKGVSSAAFAPDGKTLATTSEDGRLRVWDVDKGTEKHKLADDAYPSAFVSFAQDGRTLFEIGGGRIRSWNPATGRATKTVVSSITGDWAAVYRLSPDGVHVARAQYSGVGRWDVATGRELGVAIGMPHESIHPVVFSRDGTTLATATLDVKGTAVQLWDASDGRPLRRFPVLPTYQLAWGCDFTATGTLSVQIRTLTEFPPKLPDRIARWDTKTGAARPELRLPDGTRCIAFAPDEQLMAVASEESVALCNRVTGREVKKLPGKCGADVLTFSANGNTLAAFEAITGRTTVWSLTDRREWKWPSANEADSKQRAALRPSIALSPDGRLLAVGVEDRKAGIQIVDIATGTELWSLAVDLYGGPGQDFAFSPDGRTFAASSYDGVVRVWEIASGRERYRFTGHRSGTRSVAFSPDGRRLASASEDCTVLLWDVSTPQQPSPAERANPDQLWAALTALDAATAHRVIASLAATPDRSVPFLKERLRSPAATGEQVRQWLNDLGSDEFAVRESATAELARRVAVLGPELSRALASATSPEAEGRLRLLVNALGPTTPANRAIVRAVEALERMGRDPAAAQLLQELAKLPADCVTGREARAACLRLIETPAERKIASGIALQL
jgi:RNA polymerase sigma factor (sigma-70 family)